MSSTERIAAAIPRPLTATAAHWVSRISWALCVAGATLGLILPLPVLYEIVMDQLRNPPIWVFETTGYTIILIVFAASGYGLSTGHHFRVSLVPERFPRLALPLARLSAVLQTAFGLALLVAGVQQVMIDFTQGLRSDTLLAVPQFIPQMAFPIGGLVIALQGIAHLLVPPAEKAHDATWR
jgi:TRAP-type C4-dicarboxylate transport system permease small subunit